MKSLISLLIKNKIVVLIAILLVIFIGGYSTKKMPVDLFPEMKIPVVSIITHYPGASSKDIETLISKPIENKMLNLQEIKRVSSSSFQDISIVTVEFNWGTSIFRAKQLVMNALSEVKSQLPEGVTPVIDSVGTRLQNIYGFIIYGGENLSKLYNIIKYQVAGRLLDLDGVASVQILGGEKEAIFVNIKNKKLKQFHITISTVKDILKKYNLNIVGGFLNRGAKEYILRGIGKVKSINDIKSIPVKNGKNPVFIENIADIYTGFAPRHYIIQNQS